MSHIARYAPLTRPLRLLVALALLLGLLAWAPTATRAATLDVCPSGCSFSSIQAAINAAASGDTISIGAGTYTETLLISKNLTLQGAGANQTILKGGNFSGVVSTGQSGFTIVIDGVTITGGRELQFGGGISNQNSTMTVRNSIISGNSSSSTGVGAGGIFNLGTLTLQNSTVSGNSATRSAGGIFNNGTLTLQNSIVSGNTTASSGGGIFNNSGTLTLQNSTVSSNSALNSSNTASAGGIANNGTVTLQDSTISANVANGAGGGIVNAAQRTITIIRSTVSDNISGSGNTTSDVYPGAGVYNEGTLNVTESTVSGNRSLNSSGNSIAGGIFSFGTLNVANSTISANTGGIMTTGGTLNVANSTITNNSASFGAGGVSFSGSLGTVQNTIIANNQSTRNCDGSRLSDNGGNLSSDGSCSWSAASSRNNTNPLLGVLADNGGPTQTHALLSGSPAIDAAIAACPATDQRGVARPQGNGCDIGAFEFGQSVPTNTPTSTPTNTPVPPTNTPTNTPTDVPTSTPTNTPTSAPTNTPTNVPTSTPTSMPTDVPTSTPTNTPVSAVDTTTSFTTSANPARLGEPITFRATVTAASSATPDGTVTFLSGTAILGTGTLVTGVASFTTSSLPVGNTVITARFEGTPLFNASVSAAGTQVVRAGSSTTLTLSTPTSVFGQSITLNATVSGGTTSPSGSVTFYDGATALGTKALRTGAASVTVSTIAAGQHTLTAVYGGSPQLDGSVSPAVISTVTPAQTVAALAVAPNPSVLGQTVTLTATVSVVAPGAGKPDGTVSFFDGTTLLGSKALGGTGVATYSTSTLAVGGHSLRAEYSGSTNYSASTSTPASLVVNPASTTTTLATTATNVVNGQKITLTATVAAVAPGKGIPTGSIIFRDGATELGGVALSNGRATKQITLALGSHDLVAEYVPATNSFSASSGTTSVTVTPASTSVTLTTSGTPATFGRKVTFTATVKVSAPGVGTPTGTIIFRDGDTVLAEVALVNGKATFATTTLARGTHAITASYSGDAGNNASVSSTVAQVVN